MRTRKSVGQLVLALAALAAACGEDNPFAAFPEGVTHGTSQLWELGLEGFPSGFDIPTGQRFFVGPSPLSGGLGTFVLEARADGTLAFRPFSTVVPGFSAVRTGIRDLGAVSFESVAEVPDAGYSSPGDTLGVPVVEGHTYAFRISVPLGAIVQINYAKLRVTAVGQQLPGIPRSRFIRFEWAYQEQPLNRNVAVEEEGS